MLVHEVLKPCEILKNSTFIVANMPSYDVQNDILLLFDSVLFVGSKQDDIRALGCEGVALWVLRRIMFIE